MDRSQSAERRCHAGRSPFCPRQHLGRAILLGLESLVDRDIINTVAVDPTFRSVGVLAGIVIRTFLSLSLEVEIEGAGPGLGRR